MPVAGHRDRDVSVGRPLPGMNEAHHVEHVLGGDRHRLRLMHKGMAEADGNVEDRNLSIEQPFLALERLTGEEAERAVHRLSGTRAFAACNRNGGTVQAFRARLGKRHVAVLSIVALLGGALATGPAKAALADCPEVMPVAEVTKGMVGTGYSVSEGTEPEPFTAEVLGVLENGIGPGRDLIVVDTSSPAIEEAGGIWYGMSGSPVYVNGEFIGALAYGLTWGPSTIAGLTPAEDMLKIADRPAAMGADAPPAKVELSKTMKSRIARATGTSESASSSSMKRLLTPVSISGIGDRAMDELSETIDREKLPLVLFKGSSGSAAPAPSDVAPAAGGNFAAALSYGDVTYAGVGTISYVCEGKVLAFGHPFNYLPEGSTTAGANHAEAITIVNDSLGGSFKLANITGGIGTVDQDRFAGIRAIMGDFRPTIPVTSHIEADGGLTQRDGASDIVTSEYVPYLAWLHALSNIDFTRDEIDGGSSTASWTISGTSASGPWELTRSNIFTSDYDVNYESLFEMQTHL
ncbi:MAG: hypothetical protein GEU71_18055, partial [Actinobacteria bacterium]|nr:hypothetical protein [Actinomycetota bacterium]